MEPSQPDTLASSPTPAFTDYETYFDGAEPLDPVEAKSDAAVEAANRVRDDEVLWVVNGLASSYLFSPEQKLSERLADLPGSDQEKVDSLRRLMQDEEIGLGRYITYTRLVAPEGAVAEYQAVLATPGMVERLEVTQLVEMGTVFKTHEDAATLPALDQFGHALLARTSERGGKDPAQIIHETQQSFLKLNTITHTMAGLEAPNAYEQAHALFAEAKTVEDQTKEVIMQMPRRLPPFVESVPEPNLSRLMSDNAEKITDAITSLSRLGNSTSWDEIYLIDYLRIDYGRHAIPGLYEGVKHGQLHEPLNDIFSSFQSSSQLEDVYANLLLDEAIPLDRRSSLLRRSKMFDYQADIVAEYARRIAEQAIVSSEPEARLRFDAAFSRSMVVLEELPDNSGSSDLVATLSAAYPELSYAQNRVNYGLEAPKSPEYASWAHDRLIVRGEAALAAKLGIDPAKVEVVEIMLTPKTSELTATDDEADETKPPALRPSQRQNFTSVTEMAPILDEAEYAKLTTWLDDHGLTSKPIRLVRDVTGDDRYRELYSCELKHVLFDVDFESNKDTSGTNRDAYRRGELYMFGFRPPEVLTSGSTLASAIAVAELGERFGLPVDGSALEEADKAVRSGKLILSPHSAISIASRNEGSGEGILDPEALDLLAKPQFQKVVGRTYQRLGQLAGGIQQAGSMEDYVRSSYGEVYLANKGFVHIYDLDLSRSQAPLTEQAAFLRTWEILPTDEDFFTVGVEAVAQPVMLPQPEGLRELIDLPALNQARKKRATQPLTLDAVAGQYHVEVENRVRDKQRDRIDGFLAINNLSWPVSKRREGEKITKTLIKLGVNPNHPILSTIDTTRQHGVEVVISTTPEDILQASTLKPWKSCVQLQKGSYHEGLYEDIGNGSAIAYVMKPNKAGELQYVARSLIRVGTTTKGDMPAGAVEKTYGDKRYADVLARVTRMALTRHGFATDTEMKTYPYSFDTYMDSDDETLETHQHMYYKKTKPGAEDDTTEEEE